MGQGELASLSPALTSVNLDGNYIFEISDGVFDGLTRLDTFSMNGWLSVCYFSVVGATKTPRLECACGSSLFTNDPRRNSYCGSFLNGGGNGGVSVTRSKLIF